MSMDYVRETYSMPWLKRGLAVLVNGEPGRVKSATHYVWVLKDGEKHARPYHPNDVSLPTQS